MKPDKIGVAIINKVARINVQIRKNIK